MSIEPHIPKCLDLPANVFCFTNLMPSLSEQIRNILPQAYSPGVTSFQNKFDNDRFNMPLQASDLKELHNCIIDYLTKWSRIMSAQNLDTWTQFPDLYDNKYLDYSREELRDEFFQVILPDILTYDLTPLQLRKIEIFTDHHHFKRTDTGFVEIESEVPPPVEGVDYVVLDDADKFPEIACVVLPQEKSFQGCPPDPEIHAFVSAVHSTDEELMQFTLLPPEEIRRRAEKASKEYEETGRLPPNLENGGQVLVEKIEKYISATQRLCATLDIMDE